jgi:hypothetical protein
MLSRCTAIEAAPNPLKGLKGQKVVWCGIAPSQSLAFESGRDHQRFVVPAQGKAKKQRPRTRNKKGEDLRACSNAHMHLTRPCARPIQRALKPTDLGGGGGPGIVLVRAVLTAANLGARLLLESSREGAPSGLRAPPSSSARASLLVAPALAPVRLPKKRAPSPAVLCRPLLAAITAGGGGKKRSLSWALPLHLWCPCSLSLRGLPRPQPSPLPPCPLSLVRALVWLTEVV